MLFSVLFNIYNTKNYIYKDINLSSNEKPEFIAITSVDQLNNIIASNNAKPIMLDFYADWCVACLEFEKFTFTDKEVNTLMKQYILLKADVTGNNLNDKALMKEFNIFGPPAILFFDNAGNEVRKIMLQNINKSIKEDLVIDINLGAVDLNIDQAIIKHNELIFKRIELLKNLTPENDKIISLENQLKEIQNNLIKSLQNTIQATEEELSELIENEKKVAGRMSLAPVKYKNYWELSRQQKIKESLFLYLLEKLEETQIALAAKIGNAKIINYPHSSKNPISPNKYIVYISFISASIFFYICIIYVKNLFRDKVYSKSDIDNAGLPYVGNIPLGQKNSEIVISKGHFPWLQKNAT